MTKLTNKNIEIAIEMMGYKNPRREFLGSWHGDLRGDSGSGWVSHKVFLDLASLLRMCREREIIPELKYDSAHMEWVWVVTKDGKRGSSCISNNNDADALILALYSMAYENREL